MAQANHVFQVGDKVTFTNDQGVKFPGKTVTGSEFWEWSHSPTVQRYFFAPTDAPWCSVPARNLTAVA
tara:strand:- start:109 stop:312 length:204 start_codon:yes stop_codon:yes gene_type:complete